MSKFAVKSAPLKAGVAKLARRRPSPAMAVALCALFMATAGTSIAAKGMLGKDTIGAYQLKANAVGKAEVQSRAIVTSKLAPKSVKGKNVASKAIGAPQIAPDAVTEEKVAPDAIGEENIAANAVNQKQLAPKSVDREQIAPRSIDFEAFVPKAVKTAALDDDAVTTGILAPEAVTTNEIADSIPAAGVSRTANLTVPHSTATVVPFNSEAFDTRGMHSNTVLNSRIVAPVDGVYLINAGVQWSFSADAVGGRVLSVEKNGSTLLAYDARSLDTHDASVSVQSQTASTAAVLQAGDYIEMSLFQTTFAGGGPGTESIELLDIGNSPELNMTWIAPGPA